MNALKKISSAVAVGYPVATALIISAIYILRDPVISFWLSAALGAIMVISSIFGKKETFFVGIVFLYPLLTMSKIIYFGVYMTVFPPLLLSSLIYLIRFFCNKSFRKEFFKKGLLFYGAAFFAVALLTNGLSYEGYLLGNLVVGAILGISVLILYHTTMALGDRTAYILNLIVLFGAVSTFIDRTDIYSIFIIFGFFSSLWLAICSKHKIFYSIISAAFGIYIALFCIPISPLFYPQIYLKHQINELVDMSGAWIYGKGFFESITDSIGIGTNMFFTVLCTTGLFGLLALLTHLKHGLELLIRHFSIKKTLLLIPPIIILFAFRWGFSRSFSLMLFFVLFVSLAEISLENSRRAQIDNIRPLERGRKPRVLFPFIEAGKGHITPTTAVCDIFKKKYGDEVEVIESQFYSETGSDDLVITEKLFASAVRTQNKNHILSLLCRLGNFLAGDTFAQYVLMAMTRSGRRSIKLAKEHLSELDVDLIFTAHWSIPFYVSKDKKPHPYTIMFCPDVLSNGMFNVDCNHFLMPMKSGHDRVVKTRMYAGGVSSTVAFPIRSAAYEYLDRKDELREKNGIGKDDFVVTLCDGGYGMANLEKTLAHLVKSDAKMTLIALCGTNTELYERLTKLDPPENITLLPQPFTDKVLEFLAMSDLFVGKSGANSMAEPAFFGVPIIVTKCITYIERHIKDHYVHDLGGALFIPDPKRAARKIIEFAEHPEKLEPYKTALEDFRNRCGAEEMADLVYDSLKKIGYTKASETEETEETIKLSASNK